jgi:hypothetical protein
MAPPPPRFAALLLLATLLLAAGSAAGSVFPVRRKFPSGVGGDAGANISALRVHDGHRHGRLLAAADLPLGGLGLPTDTGYVPALASFFILGDFPVGCLFGCGDYWAGPRAGSTSRRSSSGRRLSATTSRSTLAATSSGLTASPAKNAPARADSGYRFPLFISCLCLNYILVQPCPF